MTVLVYCLCLAWLPQAEINSGNSCFQKLEAAKQEFELGFFDRVTSLITEECLAELNGTQLLLAHELLYRAYFAMDDLEQTREIISKLLEYQQDYQAPAVFGSELGRLVAAMREKAADQIDSVSLFSEDIDSAPATVFVVSGEEIQERGYRDLGEVLAAFPGLEVSRTSGTEQFLIYPRGFLSVANDALLLRIDGVEQNDLFLGSIYLSTQYPLSFIEKVVFVYGPASTIYGPNANLGVIDIITKTPHSQSGLDDVLVQTTVGDRASRRYDLSLNGAFSGLGEPLRYAVTANLVSSEGLELSNRQDSPWFGDSSIQDKEDNHWFSMRFWTENLTFGVQTWRRSESSDADNYNPLAGDNHWTPEQTDFYVNHRSHLGKGWLLLLQARLKEHKADPSASSNVRFYGLDDELEARSVHWSYLATQNRYKLQLTRQNPKKKLNLAFGVDYRINTIPGGLTLKETGELVRPFFGGLPRTPDQFNDRDLGLFANMSYHLNENWSASAGLRSDHNESKGHPKFSFPNSKSPRLALLYQRDDDTGVKLIYSKAFLNPSIGSAVWIYRYFTLETLESMGWDSYIEPPQPRKSTNLELSSHFRLGTTLFQAAIYEFSQSEVAGLKQRPNSEIEFREGNRRNHGLQIHAITDHWDPFFLTLTYSFVNARIRLFGQWQNADLIAEQHLECNLDYRRNLFKAGLQLAWVGDREIDQTRILDPTSKLENYVLINGAVSGSLPRYQNFTWQCIFRNISDLDYSLGSAFFYELVPQAGREVSVRLTYKK